MPCAEQSNLKVFLNPRFSNGHRLIKIVWRPTLAASRASNHARVVSRSILAFFEFFLYSEGLHRDRLVQVLLSDNESFTRFLKKTPRSPLFFVDPVVGRATLDSIAG
jgi:hypothetical protein